LQGTRIPDTLLFRDIAKLELS